MANNLESRLLALEQRRGVVRGVFIMLQPDEKLTPEQQAQIDEANARHHPVLIVSITGAENAFPGFTGMPRT